MARAVAVVCSYSCRRNFRSSNSGNEKAFSASSSAFRRAFFATRYLARATAARYSSSAW